jgi:diadenosine tetraphosphatase ApaH/serine/threonine PP2A family protein phosphatase
MKLALLADLHANLEAFTACLDHVADQRPDDYAFLGDLVGYGADPGPVVERVAEFAARGAVVVRGNHDEAVAATGAETMSPVAEAAVEWTQAHLSQAHLAFLRALPLTVRRGEALFVHASADNPTDWTYIHDPLRAEECLRATDATWVFAGHVHEPALYHLDAASRAHRFKPIPGVAIPIPRHRRWLAVVGSAGQPRDGNTAACYALLDTDRATLTFHRVPYDWSRAVSKIRAAGLPEALARRLERGV